MLEAVSDLQTNLNTIQRLIMSSCQPNSAITTLTEVSARLAENNIALQQTCSVLGESFPSILETHPSDTLKLRIIEHHRVAI